MVAIDDHWLFWLVRIGESQSHIRKLREGEWDVAADFAE